MEIIWKVDGDVRGLEYSFVDYVINGYYVQDHVKVAAVIQLDVDTVQDCHPAAKISSFSQIIQVVLPHKKYFHLFSI